MLSLLRIMRPWSWFFLCATLLIVVTMMVPSLFGLQNTTQWGGMYTDGWCGVELSNSGASLGAPIQSKFLWAGQIGTVWSVPMFNQEMCLIWTRKFCHQSLAEGWVASYVRPSYRKKYFTDPRNACDLPLDPTYSHWYRYAP